MQFRPLGTSRADLSLYGVTNVPPTIHWKWTISFPGHWADQLVLKMHCFYVAYTTGLKGQIYT